MIWESKELFSHQLLWKKDTESVFTVFWLRTTPFLLSLVPLFLLIYCFPISHSKNNAIHQEEWMLFQSVMKRKYSTEKEAEFPQLEQDYVFSFFLHYQKHFFSLSFHIFIVNILLNILSFHKESTFFHSHSSSHFTHNILLTFDSVNRNERDERMKW